MWPLIVEQILAVLVGMVDVIMVAQAGEAAVSGVSLVDSINLLIIQLLAALATGGAVISSQFLGRKDRKNACLAANQLLLVTIGVSLAITIIALAGNRGILSLVFGKASADVLENAQIYFYITALSYPFLAIYNSCAALYRSMGNSRVSMMTSLCMNGINVAGNALCIYALHMGVEGVALPTLISRAVAAIIMLVIVRNPKNEIHIDRKLCLGFHWRTIKNILSVGIPNGLENSMFQFGKIMVQSLVSSLGTVTIAAFAVASNLVTLEYLPGTAIGLGLITVVGQCVGAGEYEQAKKYTNWLVGVNYAILLVLCLVMGLGCRYFVAGYHLSAEAEEMAIRLIVFHSVFMIVWPPAFSLPNAMRAALDVKFTMVVSVLSMWVFRIGFSYLLIYVFHMDIMGVWIAMALDWVVRGSIFLWRYLSGKWKNKRLRS